MLMRRLLATICCTFLIFSCIAPLESVQAAAPGMQVLKEAAEPVQKIERQVIPLTETRQEILEEIMCDYISEDVVALMEAGIDYSVSDWFERDTYTYVYLKENISGNTICHICGYTKMKDGGFAYIKLSSPETISQKQVEDIFTSL